MRRVPLRQEPRLVQQSVRQLAARRPVEGPSSVRRWAAAVAPRAQGRAVARPTG